MTRKLFYLDVNFGYLELNEIVTEYQDILDPKNVWILVKCPMCNNKVGNRALIIIVLIFIWRNLFVF